jgi:hypothetical protein
VSPKKTKRSQAAQQLIENLLDELPSSTGPTHDQAAHLNPPANPSSQGEIRMFEGTGSFGPIPVEADRRVVIEDNDVEPVSLSLEDAEVPKAVAAEKPPFQGTSPVVTQMAQRSKIVRPPVAEIHKEKSKSSDPEVDFGAMTSHEPFAVTSDGSSAENENTVRVRAGTLVSDPEPRSEVIPISRGIDRGGATEIRSGVKVPPSPKFNNAGSNNGTPYTSVEASLKQSESLRIAQSRITELERELERVRRDNESLSTAGDTLRRRTDELTSKAESFEIQAREANLRLDEEKKVLRGQIQAKDRETAEMRARVEEIETRLESNFKKIRVRERELEHRLEIVKMESATLVSTKDKMLLDLKRQIDQLHHESESAKNKSQEMFGQYKEKQDTIRRVVRALRIALTILEGDDETVVPFKKAE